MDWLSFLRWLSIFIQEQGRLLLIKLALGEIFGEIRMGKVAMEIVLIKNFLHINTLPRHTLALHELSTFVSGKIF